MFNTCYASMSHCQINTLSALHVYAIVHSFSTAGLLPLSLEVDSPWPPLTHNLLRLRMSSATSVIC